MAKLTLTDISSGYLSATAYNANNALIEAALENTLSLDGTTPNQMTAPIDLNSQNLNNANVVNASSVVTTSLTLNGQAITPTTTLTGGLGAGEVTYDNDSVSVPSKSLQDALDNDYIRNDEDTTISFDFHAVELSASTKLTANHFVFDSTRASADGDGVGRLGNTSSGTYDQYIARNLEENSGQMQQGRTGDGVSFIGCITDVTDGELHLASGIDGVVAGTQFQETSAGSAWIKIISDALNPRIEFYTDGVERFEINNSNVSFGGDVLMTEDKYKTVYQVGSTDTTIVNSSATTTTVVQTGNHTASEVGALVEVTYQFGVRIENTGAVTNDVTLDFDMVGQSSSVGVRTISLHDYPVGDIVEIPLVMKWIAPATGAAANYQLRVTCSDTGTGDNYNVTVGSPSGSEWMGIVREIHT